ncbi:MAG TPA: hypothetical protein ENH34_06260 [Phycisphaerales bacterium]|nr:hypothetical protein [Phycisphaerales bacterium]
MENSKKKSILIGVVVGCVVLAAAITYKRSSDNTGLAVFKGQLIWVKCRNADCEAEYQMDKKDYYEEVEERTTGMFTPPLVCKECGEESIYAAIKCEKCGLIFFKGAVPNDFPDRCPECGFSKIEDTAKQTKRR